MTAQIPLYELYFQDYLNDCNGYHEFVTNKTRSPPVIKITLSTSALVY